MVEKVVRLIGKPLSNCGSTVANCGLFIPHMQTGQPAVGKRRKSIGKSKLSLIDWYIYNGENGCLSMGKWCVRPLYLRHNCKLLDGKGGKVMCAGKMRVFCMLMNYVFLDCLGKCSSTLMLFGLEIFHCACTLPFCSNSGLLSAKTNPSF